MHAEASRGSRRQVRRDGNRAVREALATLAERPEVLAVSVGNESHMLDTDDVVIVRRATGVLTVKEEDGRFGGQCPGQGVAISRDASGSLHPFECEGGRLPWI